MIYRSIGSEIGCRKYSIWEELLKPYKGIYTIDINGPSANNTIRFGNNIDNSHIAWSEKIQVGGIYNNSLLEFSMYHLSLCGIDVFGKMSSYWEAIIDLR